MELKRGNENQISLREMNTWEIPECSIMHPMVREDNRVKCVFWDEKDSIFGFDIVCVKAENRQDKYQTRHYGKEAIIKGDLLHQNPYAVLTPDPPKVRITCQMSAREKPREVSVTNCRKTPNYRLPK